MNCRKPFNGFGCGQCMPCRINRRRIWSHRIVLEAFLHEHNSFATLTYSEEQVPQGSTLQPGDIQLFLKRLRKAVAPERVRYFFVGEYGDQTQRPHYHAALFGVGKSLSDVVEKTWGKGHIMLGDLTLDSANYIAGYVTKKMTSWYDPRLEGRHPEFSRMSLRPGIGADYIPAVADALLSSDVAIDAINAEGDIPSLLKHGRKSLPLGRYLKGKLYENMGFEQSGDSLIRPEWKDKISRNRAEKKYEENQALYALYENSPDSENKSFAVWMNERDSQKILNTESRFNLYKPKGTI